MQNKRNIHERISMRPQIIKAIIAAGIINNKDIKNPMFRVIAGIRSNKMMLGLFD